MKTSGIAALAMLALLVVAVVSFYAGQTVRPAATQTSISVSTQTSTSFVISTTTTSVSQPLQTITNSITITSTLISTTSSIFTTTTTASQESTNATLSRSIPAYSNLQLSLSLDTASIQSGQMIKINVAMTNLLSDPNEVKSANGWPLVGLADSACGTTMYPMGFEILRGTNLSAASSSYLAMSVGPQSCPNVAVGGPISAWQFKAASQYATSVNYPGYSPMNATLGVSGYVTWNGSDSRTIVHHPFEPGIYTVAAGDAWGDVIVMQFTVA